MFIDKRILKDGSHYYSFSYNDKNGKRIRLKKSEHPHFTDRKTAEAWSKSQKAFEQSQKNLIAQKLEWKSQYFEFDSLVIKYADWQKSQAPNSWENNITWLEQYVLPWFLSFKKQNNVNGWHFLYSEFIDYLRDEATTTSRGTKLAVASSNKVIHTLNSFVRFLGKYNLIDPSAAIKCEAFPDSLQKTKSFDNVIKPDEFSIIEKKLSEAHKPSADMFRLLYFTGLRSNEGFSLPMSFLYSGNMDGILHEKLAEQDIKYYGYIVLESQCADKSRPRNPDTHEIPRKPLKGRKTIHNKNNRVIPIRDKETWNILASRYLACQEEFETRKYGSNETNYLLFPDVNNTKVSRELKVAYSNSSYKQKTLHDCRHSFCTYFVGETANFFLARAILGHKSNAFERYLHIYESISLNAKRKSQKIQVI